MKAAIESMLIGAGLLGILVWRSKRYGWSLYPAGWKEKIILSVIGLIGILFIQAGEYEFLQQVFP